MILSQECSLLAEMPKPDEKLLQAPDYSRYAHSFNSYAYSGPSNGTYKIDGETFDVGKNFMTYERYVEYKQAGFTHYFAQHTGVRINKDFCAERWEQEKVKMDAAYCAGLPTILTDQRLLNLSKTERSLFKQNEQDVGYKFENQEALDAFVQSCIALYKDHPGFYGLTLGDEPRGFHVQAYGEVYAAIKRALPNIFIQYNLLPMSTGYKDLIGERVPLLTEQEDNPAWTHLEREHARYEKYLNTYLDVLPGVGYLQYDVYPMHQYQINGDHIRALQIAAKVCRERDIEFHIVSQTFGMYKKKVLYHRPAIKADLHWRNNILLGFGVKQINCFTYWTKGENDTSAESFIDGASFVNYHGEKTGLYYWMQEIMANNQKFASVIKQFSYQGSRSYVQEPTIFNNEHTKTIDNSYVFKKLVDVQFDREMGLVTELYDKDNDNYLYMVMNIVDPGNSDERANQTNTVEFSKEYTHVVVYKDGVGTPQKLEEGNKLTIKLSAGEAVYLLPY